MFDSANGSNNVATLEPTDVPTDATKQAPKQSPAAVDIASASNDRAVLSAYMDDVAALRTTDKATKRTVRIIAERVIFGIFGDVNIDREERADTIRGGELAGKAIAKVLRNVYGKDGIAIGTVTAVHIGMTFSMDTITIKKERGNGVAFVMSALAAMVDSRRKSIDDKRDAQREMYHMVDGQAVRTFTDDEINEAHANAIAKLDKASAIARDYVANSLPLVPLAMRAIRTAGNGTVKRHTGETAPVDVAFARVLMNVTDKAVDFADSVIRVK